MNGFAFSRFRALPLTAVLSLAGVYAPLPCRATGVTFITHGFQPRYLAVGGDEYTFEHALDLHE